VSLSTEGHTEARNNKQIENTIMKKQFVKMAALAVMVLGMVSAQASAAGVSLSLNLVNGKVNVAVQDDSCCHHHVDHKKKVVHRKEVKHHDRRHEVKKHDNRHKLVVHKDNRRKDGRR
jgi:hypothetical protein